MSDSDEEDKFVVPDHLIRMCIGLPVILYITLPIILYIILLASYSQFCYLKFILPEYARSSSLLTYGGESMKEANQRPADDLQAKSRKPLALKFKVNDGLKKI